LEWAAPSGGDFVKVTSNTFSNQSSVTVDSVFNATYRDYLVTIRAYAAGGGSADDLQLQLRYSSSTQTSDYYGSYFQYDRANTLTTNGYANVSEMTICRNLGVGSSAAEVTLRFFQVNGVDNKAGIYGQGINIADSTAVLQTSGWVNVSRIYTGFLIKSSSDNITGHYTVWGLKS
jgi:hypothetical protein